MEFIKAVSDTFWSPKFWLPPGFTWNDLRSTNETKLPEFEFIYTTPIYLAIVMLFIRFVLEISIFRWLGVSLSISDNKPKPPPPNKILENAFKHRRHPSNSEMQNLAKKCDMKFTHVSNWYRQKRNLSKPSQLTKFTETAWRFLGYATLCVYGLFVMRDKEWIWDPIKCWTGFPKFILTDDIQLYYALELAFYWSLLLRVFFDVKRKDFKEQVLHHFVTIALLSLSWFQNMVRIGTWLLVLFDPSDVLLEAAKLANYAKANKLCDAIFIVFTISWVICRVFLYAIIILKQTMYHSIQYIEYCNVYILYNVLLTILFGLQLYWTYTILMIALNSITRGKVDDDRSDEESEADDAAANSSNQNHAKNK